MRTQRKADYIVKRAVHGDNFKPEVVKLITGQYGVSAEAAETAFDNCMVADYAVILPISKKHPNGVMIATDLYRQMVAIG